MKTQGRDQGTVGQEAVELICQNARKMRQNEAMSLWPLLTTKMKLIWMKVLKKWLSAKKHFWPCQWWHCIFLRYTYITPIFWGQTDLTQLGHIYPISWGNSGYINPYANIKNVDVELIRKPKGPNWPPVGGGRCGTPSSFTFHRSRQKIFWDTLAIHCLKRFWDTLKIHGLEIDPSDNKLWLRNRRFSIMNCWS